jgi:hypothetical protein
MEEVQAWVRIISSNFHHHAKQDDIQYFQHVLSAYDVLLGHVGVLYTAKGTFYVNRPVFQVLHQRQASVPCVFEQVLATN